MKTKANPQAVINKIERRNIIEARVALVVSVVVIIISTILI